LRSKVPTSPTDCDLARESVSLQLDGELPEQDFDRLETHLRFCPECSAWADQVGNATLWLRDADLEAPAGGSVLPRHGRRWRVGSALALASAAAVVAAMFVAPGQRLSVNSRSRQLSESRLVSAGQETVAAPRLTRLEDGRFPPVTSAPSVRPF
jgi:predicted anti-sigma-YlaC factor YlaD